jgi:hypothetical protein
MINDLDNLVFKLDNENSYELIENVVYNNQVYVYLVNIEDELDSIFKKLIKNEDGYALDDIEPGLFKDVLLPLFIKKFENY